MVNDTNLANKGPRQAEDYKKTNAANYHSY